MWHIYLISRGETSIERLINHKERSRLKKLNVKFVNPYDYGIIENWKKLLVVRDFRYALISTDIYNYCSYFSACWLSTAYQLVKRSESK